MIRVLFVCMGNICRSPALAGALQHLAEKRGVSDKLLIDSSGLTTYYVGKQADHRTREAALKKHMVIDHIAKSFEPVDFQKFDYVFAVTNEVKKLLLELATPEEQKKVYLATAFSKKFPNEEVPDPFYQGAQAFDDVIEMAFDASERILDKLFP